MKVKENKKKMSKHFLQQKFKIIDSVWVIRAGVRGSADCYFMNENIIVLQEQGFEDLCQLEPTRQAFYQVYASRHPNASLTAITSIGGKFYRFMYEMQIGVIVLYPSLKTQKIYCGEIISKYQFVKNNKEFPHQREIRWITSIPKKSLSKKAQNELGAARTLFKYKNNINEILEKLKFSL
jgi:predicted Mrr-cat superfamily restriction endonuclease